MSVDIDRERQDIESILKTIYTTYGFSDDTLYYKMKTGKMKYIDEVSYKRDFARFFNIIFDQNLDWALYVDYVSYSDGHGFISAVDQLVGYFSLSDDILSLFTRPVYDKDPLTQLLMHRRLLLKSLPQRSYFCFYVKVVKQGEPISILSGKQGIVAYCTTLTNFVHLVYEVGIKSVKAKINRLHRVALDKLDEYYFRHWAPCDIECIRSLVHDEIEEAERIMKQYGIIRVAIALD